MDANFDRTLAMQCELFITICMHLFEITSEKEQKQKHYKNIFTVGLYRVSSVHYIEVHVGGLVIS